MTGEELWTTRRRLGIEDRSTWVRDGDVLTMQEMVMQKKGGEEEKEREEREREGEEREKKGKREGGTQTAASRKKDNG